MITEKTNGKYLVDARDANGIRIQRTFRTLTEAKVFEATLTTQKYNRRLVNNGMMEPRYSFPGAIEDYKSTKIGLRPRSQQIVFMVVSEFEKFITSHNLKFLDQLTPRIMDKYFNELTKARKDPRRKSEELVRRMPKTINFHLSVIREFLQLQFVKGYIAKHPMLHIKNLRVDEKIPEFFSEHELKDYFNQEMNESDRAVFMCFLFSGLRFNELANLEWNDIDFQRKLLRVQVKQEFTPKSKSSNRVIPINGILFQIILKRFEQHSDKKFVFTSPKGFKLRERRTLTICKKIALKAGIKSRAFIHKFRHTYATMLILRGVPIQNIKELLGHSSIKETERYAHNKADHLFSDVSRLDNLLNP